MWRLSPIGAGHAPSVPAAAPSSREAFATLLDVAPFGLVVFGPDRHPTECGTAVERLLGGRGSAPWSRAHALAGAALDSGHPQQTDCVALNDGIEHSLRLRCFPIATGGALLVVEDTTVETRLALSAATDPLTGALNHREFHERLAGAVARAHRQGHDLAVALIDLDNFKPINDTYGHQIGDRVLVDVVEHLRAAVREGDVVARIGGDELALVLPDCDLADATAMAERVRATIAAADLGDGQKLTLSIGVSSLTYAASPDALVGSADRALYWAKRNGRDLVWSATEGGPDGEPRHRSHAAAAVRALARAVDLKDSSTRQHSDRVAELAGRLAEELGWSCDDVHELRQAAIVRDVGKVSIPDAGLLKPGRLTDEEYALVKEHARLGAEIAAEILSTRQTAWLRGHHERLDGSGYPDGLADDEIPLGARILAAADAFDVMTIERSYSSGRRPSEAVAELERHAGTQFDPAVVAVFRSPRFVRYLRLFENQQTARRANARAVDGGGTVTVHCECGDPACTAILAVRPRELHPIHEHPRRFVLCDGHEAEDVERVVSRRPGFVVVEKVI